MEPSGQFGMLAQAVAVPSDVDDVAVVDQKVDERRGHHLVAKDLAPLFKAFCYS